MIFLNHSMSFRFVFRNLERNLVSLLMVASF